MSGGNSPWDQRMHSDRRSLRLIILCCQHQFWRCRCGQNSYCLQCGFGMGATSCRCDGVLLPPFLLSMPPQPSEME
jgi:hypothetical protein